TRFTYRPKVGAILTFLGCVVLAIVAINFGLPWQLAIAAALAVFILLLTIIGKRFQRSLANNDIAFWLISQRMLPPVAVVIPIYVLFQRLHLLATWAALFFSYVAYNLTIVVW